MLTSVYIVEEIDQVEDWVDSIKEGTKAMMTLYDQIKEVENRARAQILEVDKLYSVASMDIFTDNSMDELESTETIVHQFISSIEEVRDHTNIQKIFKIEEILNKLDDKLNDFRSLKQYVRDFNKEAKRQYEALNLSQLDEVASLIEKFKVVYSDIISKKG